MLIKKKWDVKRFRNGQLSYRAQYDVWLLLFIPVLIKQTYEYNPGREPMTFLSGDE